MSALETLLVVISDTGSRRFVFCVWPSLWHGGKQIWTERGFEAEWSFQQRIRSPFSPRRPRVLAPRRRCAGLPHLGYPRLSYGKTFDAVTLLLSIPLGSRELFWPLFLTLLFFFRLIDWPDSWIGSRCGVVCYPVLLGLSLLGMHHLPVVWTIIICIGVLLFYRLYQRTYTFDQLIFDLAFHSK